MSEVLATIAVVGRAVAVALLAYLTIVAAVQLVVGLLLARRAIDVTGTLVRAVDRITPNWMSVVTVGVVGVTLLGPSTPASADDDRTSMPWATSTAAPSTDPPTVEPPTMEPPTLEPIDGDPADPPTLDDLSPVTDLPPVVGQPTPTVDALVPPLVIERAATIHVVQPGEHFWSIAEQVVGDRAAVDPSATESVDRYWRRLVDANRDRLADPDQPDLLYPGQELVLP
jgi:nucleoid-associated protein YgaU